MDIAVMLGPDMVKPGSVQQVVDREVVADCEPSSSEGISPRKQLKDFHINNHGFKNRIDKFNCYD